MNNDTLYKQKQGYELEYNINFYLEYYGVMFGIPYIDMIDDKIYCLRETEIVSEFGNSCWGIDHLIIFNQGNQKQFIAIQDKYRDEKINEEVAKKLDWTVLKLEQKLKIKCKALLVVIKSDITSYAQEVFNESFGHYVIDIIKHQNLKQLSMLAANKICWYCNIFNNTEIFNPFPHQLYALNKWYGQSGIVCHPTGSGKSILELLYMSKYFERNEKNIILFITQYAEVAASIFNPNTIEKMKMNHYLPLNLQYIQWVDNKKAGDKQKDVEFLYETHKPTVLCTLANSLNNHYKEDMDKIGLPFHKIGLVINDECHHLGDDNEISNTIQYIKERSNCSIVGFSATPIRSDGKNNKLYDIFKNNNEFEYIDMLLFFDAIRLGLCTPFKIFFNPNENINEILNNSTKSIIRVSGTHSVDEWYHRLISTTSIKIYKSHYRNDKDNRILEEFKKEERKACLIVSDKCREGFDCKEINTIININPPKDKSVISIIQEIGRGTRVSPGKTICNIYNIFTDYNANDIKDTIANYFNSVVSYIGYENMEELDIESLKGEIRIGGEGGGMIGFNISDELYGEDIEIRFNEVLNRDMSYEKAKRIIKYKNIKTVKEAKSSIYLPREPEEYFRNKFVSWFNYLGIDSSSFISVEDMEREIFNKQYNVRKMKEEGKNGFDIVKLLFRERIPLDDELVEIVYDKNISFIEIIELNDEIVF